MLPAEGVALVRVGTVLAGRYRLEHRVGSGGMGEVWRGFDQVLGRTVAVKRLLAAPADERNFVDRFRAEARIMATISHPGVVEVYDFGDDSVAGLYLVMKYINGESLAHTLARTGRLSAEATMRLVAEAAEALHAAHEVGVSHRDVKPGNLLLGPDGSALLTDFGIARSAGASELTATGALTGTAGYLAPERANGQPATAQSDIYSLGVVAYRCLAGHLPFAGDSLVELAMRHVHDEPPPLPADVPPRVRAVVERAMAKDLSSRWPSGAVLAVQARHVLASVPFHHQAAPVTTSPPSKSTSATASPQSQATVTTVSPPRHATMTTLAQERSVSGRRGARRLLVAAAAVLVIAITVTISIVLSRVQPQSPPGNPVADAVSPGGNVGAVGQTAGPAAASALPASGSTRPTTVPGTTRPKAGVTVPAAPRNLTATAISASTIRLQWTDWSADEDGFDITNAVTSRNVTANTNAYDWDGMPPATYTCFKVRAYNSSGASAYYPVAEMDWVCATTQNGTGPAKPTNLTATALNSSTVRLRWSDNSTDESGFSVTDGAVSRNVGTNVEVYDWHDLVPGTYKCFMVRSHKSSGVSDYSEWACVTTPPA